MATKNIQVLTTWVKLVDAGKFAFLVTSTTGDAIEYAVVDVDVAPVVTGHKLGNNQSLTRSAIGAGHVWAKAPRPVLVVVSDE